jgi:hypothetical protein
MVLTYADNSGHENFRMKFDGPQIKRLPSQRNTVDKILVGILSILPTIQSKNEMKRCLSWCQVKGA